MTGGLDLERLLTQRLDRYPVTIPGLVRGDSRAVYHGDRPLRALLPQLDAAALARLLDSVIWLGAPLDRDRRAAPGLSRVLVVAAAPEDAFLAMGGYLLRQRGRKDCRQAIFAALEAAVPRADGRDADPAPCRRDRAALAARLTALTNVWCNLLRPGEADAASRDACVALVYDRLARQAPTDVFVPAPVGPDPGRGQLFAAARQIFTGGYFRQVRFHVYEPLFEAEKPILIDDFLAGTENKYLRLDAWTADIAGVLADKRELARLLCPHLADVGGQVEATARRVDAFQGDGAGFAERFWTLRLTFGPA